MTGLWIRNDKDGYVNKHMLFKRLTMLNT